MVVTVAMAEGMAAEALAAQAAVVELAVEAPVAAERVAEADPPFSRTGSH